MKAKSTTVGDNRSGEAVETKKSRPFVADVLVRLVKEQPLGTVGLVVTVILLLTGIFADVLAPYGMNEPNMAERLSPPSAKYWFGTDNVGRDLLSRVIFGARISVIVGLSASVLATSISLFVGILSGYIGGKFDLLVQRFVDTVLCIPPLILLMVLINIIGPGIWQVIVVMGLGVGITGSRIIRGAVIGIKENVYVMAATSIGCSTTKIITRHIFPNIMAPTIVLFSTRVPLMILTEASLSFLGYGIPPPTPSWGSMLSGSGRQYMTLAPWMIIPPGIALAVVVYGVNMFGDALRDILDPRMKGGVGRFGVKGPKKKIPRDAITQNSN